MMILGIIVGTIYGVLVRAQRRFPWPARPLLTSMGLATITVTALRFSEDSSTSQPWGAGIAAFGLTSLLAMLYTNRQERQQVALR